MKFHNTIGASGQTLINFNQRVGKCERVILIVFETYRWPMTPPEVHKIMESLGYKYALTSIRRSMTDMTRSGLLVKGTEQKPGIYDVPNYTWRLA